MAGKIFETLIKVTAKNMASPVLAKVSGDLKKVEKQAEMAQLSFGKMFGAVVAGIASLQLARKAWDTFTGAIVTSFEAAMDVQKQHEALRNSVARNWKADYTKLGETVDSVTESMIALTEAQERWKFDAEDMQAGVAKLNDALSPKQIKEFFGVFENIVAKNAGVNATKEQIEDIALSIDKLITGGSPKLLRQLFPTVTPQELEALKAATTAYDKMLVIQKVQQRIAPDEAKRLFSTTTAGKVRQAMIQAGNLAEAFGKPLTEPVGQLADAFQELYVEMGPVATKLGDEMQPLIKNLTTWVKENKGEIIAWAQYLGSGLIQSISDTTRQIKWWWDMAVKSWQDTKGQFLEVVTWLDTWFIKPIANLFDWLGAKIMGWWEYLLPKLERLKIIHQELNPAPGTAGMAHMRAMEGRIQQQKGHGYAPYTQVGMANQISASPYTPSMVAAANSGVLRNIRASFADELKDPAVRDKLIRVAQAEVGTGHPERLQAFMEEVLNQSAARHHTIAQTLTPAYFDTLRHGALPAPSAAQIAKHDEALQAVLAGGNISNWSTGNWSGPQGRGFGQAQGGYLSKILGGEQFGVEAADVPWVNQMKALEAAEAAKAAKQAPSAEKATKAGIPVMKATAVHTLSQGPVKGPAEANRDPFGIRYGPWNQPKPPPPPKPLDYGKGRGSVSMENAMMKDPRRIGINRMIQGINARQRTEGAVGGQNVAMNAPITIHGVPTGQEGAVGREVTRALQSNTREFTAQYKKARSDDYRLGYV